jgi:hypothetical protein
MGHFSFLSGTEPAFLLGGLGLVIFAVLCAITGEAPLSHRAFAYRDEDPKRFWRRVVAYFLVGLSLLCIGLFLSSISN